MLQKNGLTPAPETDRRTLMRRLCFDLTGLPPTPCEIDAFVHDAVPDAYEQLVERLLASPHYGERWAQHWLDVVRFAESDGFETTATAPACGATAITSSRASTTISPTINSSRSSSPATRSIRTIRICKSRQ